MLKIRILIIFSIISSCLVFGADYYVATYGNDNYPGTFDLPWATWQKAFNEANAGDIVYIRGGVYYPVGIDDGGGTYHGVKIAHKDGTAENMINIWAFPGETPILDCSNMMQQNVVGIWLWDCDYWYLKGLHIRDVKQQLGNHAIGLYLIQVNHCKFELLKSYSNGWAGIVLTKGDSDTSTDNLLLNCDSYDNYDPYSDPPGGNADGFSISFLSPKDSNTIKGCRAWGNSDDGFDFWRNEGIVLVDSCWAFSNGLDHGDGNGFKLGRTDNTTDETYRRYVMNCIAANNRSGTGGNGFDQNLGIVLMKVYNNIAYNNSWEGFLFSSGNVPHIIRNNLSYCNGDGDWYNDSMTNIIHDHNSWNASPSITITDADFISIDTMQLYKTRKGDGALPDIDFLKLAPGSDLIDAGLDVGLPYSGIAPDLGAFETSTYHYIPPLIYLNSVIEDANPSQLELTYDLTLANIEPAASAFSVYINSVVNTVNSVAISGTKVVLTLANPAVYGDVITVAYTKPSINPLQNAEGGQAATLTTQSVTNRVSVSNTHPIVVINSDTSSYSGFIGEIDASKSYDLDHDNLSYKWIVPDNISVSSKNSLEIQFLSPIVKEPQKVEFTFVISDGQSIQSKVIPVEILPYKPELKMADILKIEASDSIYSNYPKNAIDGNTRTLWSVKGENQWLVLQLKEAFKIQHIMLAFQSGLNRESYFDILGSEDNITWEPILVHAVSSDFSGDLQVFDFPSSMTGNEYSFIKLVGHGNSFDSWNYIAEFRIFGYPQQITSDPIIIIFPNPAQKFINISVFGEKTQKPNNIRIVNLSGTVVFDSMMNPEINQSQIPISLIRGVYIIQVRLGSLNLFNQKLIIN